MKKVVIIGGGIAGLAAAYTLAEKQKQGQAEIDYLLIEREERLGGKVLTEQVDGFVIEGGPDCFLSQKPWAAQLASKVGIRDDLLGTNEENQGTYVLSGGRLHKLPEGLMLMVPTKIIPFAMSSLISWPGKIRMAFDLFLPKKKGDGDESLADFVTRRLGREALEKIAEPLIGGIHAGDAHTMSLKASFPRFLEMERNYGSLIRAMLAARKKAPPRKPDAKDGPRYTYFMSFRRGMGELPGTVAACLDSAKVLLGRRVTAVKRAGKGFLVEGEGMEPLKADALIVATMANHAAEILHLVDPVLREKLQEIPHVSSATVSLAFRTCDINRPLEGFGFVIPRIEGRKIMAVTYSSRKWKYRVPDDSVILMRIFVGGAANQDLVALDDAEMLKMVRAELEDILGIRAEPIMARIYRWFQGMPQYTLGHLERLEIIEKRLQEIPGLYLAGGSYWGVGVPDCIRSGTEAAEKAIAHLLK